jgi:hypothetical protein
MNTVYHIGNQNLGDYRRTGSSKRRLCKKQAERTLCLVRPAFDFQLSTVSFFLRAVTGVDADIFRGEIAGPVARGGAACVQIHHDVDMRR